MNDTRDCCCDQPLQTEHKVEQANQAKIVVVCFTLLHLVTLVVDQMPCDTTVDVTKEERLYREPAAIELPILCR